MPHFDKMILHYRQFYFILRDNSYCGVRPVVSNTPQSDRFSASSLFIRCLVRIFAFCSQISYFEIVGQLYIHIQVTEQGPLYWTRVSPILLYFERFFMYIIVIDAWFRLIIEWELWNPLKMCGQRLQGSNPSYDVWIPENNWRPE